MRLPVIAPVFMVAALLTGHALAQAPAPGPSPQVGNTRPLAGPALALALEAAQTALETCKAGGYSVGVSVVDETGGLRVVLGSDGALAADSNGSRRAATLAAALKMPGAEIVEQLKTDKALGEKIAANRDWLAHEGAVLIKAGDKVYGAIAVEGHPHTPQKDMACAQAGVDKIKARLK